MNKFLKIAIVVVLCLIVILTVTLFACGNQNDNPGGTTTTTTTSTPGGEDPECTEHTDADEDNKCDNCGADVTPDDPECTEHTDADGDNKCDTCGADVTPDIPECTEHTDADGDNECDTCGADVTPDTPECTEHTDADGDNKCDTCGADVSNTAPSIPTPDFTEVDDTVYVISIKLNVRTSPEIPSGESNIVAEIDAKFATALNRTGYNDEWTRIKLDGVEYYVKSDYVSSNKPTTEFDEIAGGETVYIVNVASAIHVRSTTNLDFTTNILTTLKLGDELKRLGIAPTPDADGIVWSKVEVTLKDGSTEIGYINSKYLASEPDGDTESDMGIIFEDNSDIIEVIAEKSINLRKLPLFIDGEGDADIEKISVPNGTLLQRIGIASEEDDEGIIWSKVLYKDEVYYVSSNPKYISVKTPGNDTGKPSSYFDYFEITLPSTFVTVHSDSHSIILATPDKTASVSISFSGDTLLSEKQFVEALIHEMELDGIVEPRVHTGVVYFEFELVEEESNTTVYTVVAVVNASEHTYYTVSFTEVGTCEELQAKFFGYMESIRLINE